MAGRKALPNQQKSAVRARLATQQASPPVDLSDLEADVAALQAEDIVIDGRLDALEAEDVVIDGRLDTLEAAPPDYTSTDFDSDFASKTTTDLTEGTNLYYTTTRANSAIDTRVDKAYVDALNVDADTLDGYDIGTSGGTIPLLNGANTWGSLQTLSSGLVLGPTSTSYVAGSLGYTDANWGFIYRPPQAGAISAHAFTNFAGTILFQATEAGVFSVLGNPVWHSGNDGAGSGLDADLLDSYDSTAFGRLAADQTWTGTQTFSTLVASSSSATPLGAVKLGRSTVQYVDFHGSAGGNYITSVSDVGNPKADMYLGVSTDSGATHAATWRFRSTDGSIATGSNTFWHSGTFAPANYAALASANVFTNTQYISMASSLPFRLIRTGSTGGVGTRYTNDAGYVDIFGIPTGSGTGQLAMPDGTVSLPGMVFTNDTNTGVYRYTTDQVGIAAGGSTSAIFSNSTVTLPGVTTGDRKLWIGQGRSGNGYSYIDIVGDTTYTAYGLRLIRHNGGANTTSSLEHRGTGPLVLSAADAGTIRASIAGTERVRINGADTQTLELQGQINLTTSIGTLRSKLDWGITQSGLTISNEDNTPLSLRTTGVNRLVIDDAGKTTINSKTAARVNSGTATNSGLISWGTAAPGTLAEGEMYLRHT